MWVRPSELRWQASPYCRTFIHILSHTQLGKLHAGLSESLQRTASSDLDALCNPDSLKKWGEDTFQGCSNVVFGWAQQLVLGCGNICGMHYCGQNCQPHERCGERLKWVTVSQCCSIHKLCCAHMVTVTHENFQKL